MGIGNEKTRPSVSLVMKIVQERISTELELSYRAAYVILTILK